MLAVPVAAEQATAPPAPAATSPQAGAAAPARGELLLPTHSRDPVKGSIDNDPLLRLGRETVPASVLGTLVRETIERAPTIAEAVAMQEAAGASLAEARSARSPSVDITISSYKVIDRRFGNNPENVIERSRPGRRTDFLLNADQLLLDAGGAKNRIGAAKSRFEAAGTDIENSADRTALETVAAWYDVFTFRALVELSSAFAESQRELRLMVLERIQRGVSADADIARVDSYIAAAEARLARFRRQQGQAEARFEALTGSPPPAGLARAAVAGPTVMSRDLAVQKALETPQVRGSRLAAEAARRDAKAARADTLPTLGAGIESGRYGIYETPRDFDIRARVTIRQRLFGGIEARADQARARADAADARATRVRVDAARDAEIAWSDVETLRQQLAALESTYIASRRSRDTIAERFRVSSGTLFDVLGAEDSYFETAVGYLQALTELDASRYALLSRTGELLPSFGIVAPVKEDRR